MLGQLKKHKSQWRARRSSKIIHLPGVGVCIPDLIFSHPERKERVYLELMGYWSREAVWKRVELVQAGISLGLNTLAPQSAQSDPNEHKLYLESGPPSSQVPSPRSSSSCHSSSFKGNQGSCSSNSGWSLLFRSAVRSWSPSPSFPHWPQSFFWARLPTTSRIPSSVSSNT